MVDVYIVESNVVTRLPPLVMLLVEDALVRVVLIDDEVQVKVVICSQKLLLGSIVNSITH